MRLLSFFCFFIVDPPFLLYTMLTGKALTEKGKGERSSLSFLRLFFQIHQLLKKIWTAVIPYLANQNAIFPKNTVKSGAVLFFNPNSTCGRRLTGISKIWAGSCMGVSEGIEMLCQFFNFFLRVKAIYWSRRAIFSIQRRIFIPHGNRADLRRGKVKNSSFKWRKGSKLHRPGNHVFCIDHSSQREKAYSQEHNDQEKRNFPLFAILFLSLLLFQAGASF